ncbi:hypothetical protein Q1W73_15300 [Asticcacaulis sp. ZE23SCel15]|uniref:hypothetical protein n=1 Tax=Asticcacaulis sp. ZE23SCel15 TaxID=3059027 RepID=UPI00265E6109|nr:hypothetical protein [Asticcacaulis sp. ZE23SCel15]WKL57011.1 hypothetical protein Q1W73_15300 [Asticcacaulis sp. ZE23SCel15]
MPRTKTNPERSFATSFADEGPRAQAATGLVFLCAGLLYGAQTLAYGAIEAGMLTLTGAGYLILTIAPTIPFLAVIAFVSWQGRTSQKGVGTRALTACYTSAGLVNLVIAIAFGVLAARKGNMTIWLLYPIVICAMQGAVWYAACTIRRKLWLGMVSAGWFAVTVVLTLLVTNVQAYLLVLGLALWGLMAAPGYVLMRRAAKEPLHG